VILVSEEVKSKQVTLANEQSKGSLPLFNPPEVFTLDGLATISNLLSGYIVLYGFSKTNAENSQTYVLVFELPEVTYWQVYIGSKEKMYKVHLDAQQSFDFSAGAFLNGKTKLGFRVSLLIPDPRRTGTSSLLPSLNGEELLYGELEKKKLD
jgi:hypothetical protein